MDDVASSPKTHARHINLAPEERDVAAWTDHYFNRSKGIVARFGDLSVTYAIFMRRPVVSAPRLMLEWLESNSPFHVRGLGLARYVESRTTWRTTPSSCGQSYGGHWSRNR